MEVVLWQRRRWLLLGHLWLLKLAGRRQIGGCGCGRHSEEHLHSLLLL